MAEIPMSDGSVTDENEKLYRSFTCEVCGNDFLASSSRTARYCHGKCKQNAYLARKTAGIKDVPVIEVVEDYSEAAKQLQKSKKIL